MLVGPSEIKTFPEPIHLDRIKMASVRVSEPLNIFKVVTRTPDISTVSTSCQTAFVKIDNYEHVLTETPVDSKKVNYQ